MSTPPLSILPSDNGSPSPLTTDDEDELGTFPWYQAFILAWAQKECLAADIKRFNYHMGDDVFTQLRRAACRSDSTLWEAWCALAGRHLDALNATTPPQVRRGRLADLLGYAFLGLALCECAEQEERLMESANHGAD